MPAGSRGREAHPGFPCERKATPEGLKDPHHTALIPADRSHRYGQLVGGGPQPESASLVEGNADANVWTLKLRRLDGTVVHEVRVRPVGE